MMLDEMDKRRLRNVGIIGKKAAGQVFKVRIKLVELIGVLSR